MSNRTSNLILRKQELPLHNDTTGLFLKVMISIAVLLFAVTLAGVLSINAMLAAWNNSILGSLTVQIMPVNDIDQQKAREETLLNQEKTLEFLKSLPEVDSATPLSDEQLLMLLQPWLGDGIDILELPTPRLIDVRIKHGASIDYPKLAEKLAEVSPYASLDNHKLWLNKLISFADGLKILAMSILVLVVAISAGAIFYTTQTNLGLHKNIIEILHIMGAKDTYVAQQYARQDFFIGLFGGIIGLVFAIPTIFMIAHLAAQIEGGIINEARLSSISWLMILLLPLFSAVTAMITAYYTVKRTLEKMM